MFVRQLTTKQKKKARGQGCYAGPDGESIFYLRRHGRLQLALESSISCRVSGLTVVLAIPCASSERLKPTVRHHQPAMWKNRLPTFYPQLCHCRLLIRPDGPKHPGNPSREANSQPRNPGQSTNNSAETLLVSKFAQFAFRRPQIPMREIFKLNRP